MYMRLLNAAITSPTPAHKPGECEPQLADAPPPPTPLSQLAALTQPARSVSVLHITAHLARCDIRPAPHSCGRAPIPRAGSLVETPGTLQHPPAGPAHTFAQQGGE